MVTNKGDKEDTLYLNIAAAVYMTHNLSLYITTDPDNQTVDIKTMNGTVLKTQSASTIDLYVLVENEHMHIKPSNIYYLSNLDANLILLGILEEKRCEFQSVDGLLQIEDKEDNIMLESIRDDTMYPLQQPKFQA